MMRIPVLASTLVVAVSVAACTGSSGSSSSASSASTLRVLASSELADMKPILDKARQEIGVDVQLTEAGTLDASSDIASGTAAKSFDAAWLSSNRYLSLLPGGTSRLATSTKIMASPVVVGVRPEVARSLGWSADKPPTWTQIEKAAASKKFTYAMTNPAASNSGFSTLVAVATSVTGGGAALDEAGATKAGPQLRSFFAGQSLTAGSTGWLTSKFVADTSVGGLMSYESTLLQLNKTTYKANPLVLIAPADGVVTADYPLSFLTGGSSGKRALFDKLVTWLRTKDTQQSIMSTTWRRPLAGGVKLDPAFGTRTLIEVPFPASREAADGLISSYLNVARRPATTVYVLDTSGSMQGDRLTQLKKAMGSLTTDSSSSFTAFHARENITIEPFSTTTGPVSQFVVPQTSPSAELAAIKAKVDGLSADGSTSMYEAVEQAYTLLDGQRAKDSNVYPSIVLLTDGEANGHLNLSDFRSFYKELPSNRKAPVFTIRFGDAKAGDLDEVATITGGKSFDGTMDLASAFRTIRGYQ